MPGVYDALSAVDPVEVLASWRVLCEGESVLAGRRANLSVDLVRALINEVDVDPDYESGLASTAVMVINEYAEVAGSAGVALRQLPLLARAFAEQLASWPAEALVLQVRAQAFVEAAMVIIASRSFALLDSNAHRDELTGLANKRALERDLREACAAEIRPVGLLFADIDGLKQVNDKYGHEAGNQHIQEFAGALLAACSNRAITAYRWAGDEHVLLTIGMSKQDMLEVVRDVKALFDSFSWGFASIPDDADDPVSLLKLSDKLMYKEKQRRKAVKRARERRLLRCTRSASRRRGLVRWSFSDRPRSRAQGLPAEA